MPKLLDMPSMCCSCWGSTWCAGGYPACNQTVTLGKKGKIVLMTMCSCLLRAEPALHVLDTLSTLCLY